MAYPVFGFITPTQIYKKTARIPSLTYTVVTVFSDSSLSFYTKTLDKDMTRWDGHTAARKIVLPPELFDRMKTLIDQNMPMIKQLSATHAISEEGDDLRRTGVVFYDSRFLVPDYVLEAEDACYLPRYLDFPDQNIVPFYALIRRLADFLSVYFRSQKIRPTWAYHVPAGRKDKNGLIFGDDTLRR